MQLQVLQWEYLTVFLFTTATIVTIEQGSSKTQEYHQQKLHLTKLVEIIILIPVTY